MSVAFARLLLCHVRWTGLTPPPVSQPFYLLQSACGQGAISTAQWITTQFPIGVDQVRRDNNWLLHRVCSLGQHAAAQWLVTHFNIRGLDIWTSGCLGGACSGGHLATAQWLFAQFDGQSRPGADDRAGKAGDYLGAACVSGHLSIIQWLVTQFGLTASILARTLALPNACIYGHLDIVRWLVVHFTITKATDVEIYYPNGVRGLLTYAINGDHLELVLWLAGHFHFRLVQHQSMCRYYINNFMVPMNGRIEAWLALEYRRMCEESAACMAEIREQLK